MKLIDFINFSYRSKKWWVGGVVVHKILTQTFCKIRKELVRQGSGVDVDSAVSVHVNRHSTIEYISQHLHLYYLPYFSCGKFGYRYINMFDLVLFDI